MDFSILILIAIVAYLFRLRSHNQDLAKRLDRLEGFTASLSKKQLAEQQETSPDKPMQAEVAQEKAHVEPPIEQAIKQTPPSTQNKRIDVEPREPSRLDLLAANIHDNWMLWLGGLCVALAGIYLAKYSIEQGLLGPKARIAAGVVTGISLHAAAEWLRRKTGESHPSFAALAGGGSIALFAIILAALHLYEMVSPNVAFILLALVALATMVLAYYHGPALAAIGLIGAYTVPIFVSDGSGRVQFAMLYSLVITAAGLLLMSFVYRRWLWRGIMVGALGWWVISLGYAGLTLNQGWYLAVLAYFILAIPTTDWLLKTNFKLDVGLPQSLLMPISSKSVAEQNNGGENNIRYALFIIIAAMGATLLGSLDMQVVLFASAPLLILLLIASRLRQSLSALPWLLVLVGFIVVVLSHLGFDQGQGELQALSAESPQKLVNYFVAISAIAVVLGWFNLAASPFKAIWSSFITLVPVLALSIVYFLNDELMSIWQWAAVAGLFGGGYLAVASVLQNKSKEKDLIVWLIFSGHFAASLAAVMLTQEGRLTLAFSAQIISTAWIIRTFKIPQMGWILKILVGIVIVRLTFNPWLVDYSTQSHWSLWTYGGSTLCGLVAMRLLKDYPKLSKWAEAAAIHLFALFAWTELRYWMNDGDIFSRDSSLLEVSLSMLLFGVLSIVYHIRGAVSETLTTFYTIFSSVLLVLALLCYFAICFSVLVQDPWSWEHIASTPLLNMMLLSFGTPIALGIACWRFHHQSIKSAALMFSGIAAFVFLNLQIKHLWQGDIRLFEPMQNGELYTYSLVWMIIAIVAVLGGSMRANELGEKVYKVGLALMGLVIAKLFLVDMSDLDGLYRVASFMGLGISLLGVSYLHQKIKNSFDK